MFLLVCLGIAAIVSALHDALARAQQLANDARRAEAPRDGDNPLRNLAQFAPAALFMTDAAQACTYCNRAWLAIRGRTLPQELGNGWLEGVHAEDLARRREAFAKALATRERQEVAYRLKCADGGYREVRDVVVAHVNARRQVVGLLGATFEIATTEPEPHHDLPAVEDPSL
jgi:PAS domain S-box-containing protein